MVVEGAKFTGEDSLCQDAVGTIDVGLPSSDILPSLKRFQSRTQSSSFLLLEDKKIIDKYDGATAIFEPPVTFLSLYGNRKTVIHQYVSFFDARSV